MKGRLYLSEEYINGSCFIVELPGGHSLSTHSKVPETQEVIAQDLVLLPWALRILLVDDCLASSLLLQRRLEMVAGSESALHFKSALTGEQALNMLGSSFGDGDFDVVIIDQNMHSAGGELLGHEVVRQIRGRLNLQRTVVIGCTGSAATCRNVVYTLVCA